MSVVLGEDTSSIYDHRKKLELMNKIKKIVKKDYLADIFDIITTETSDYNENINGIFIFFHNLSNDVYEKIEIYVDDIYRRHSINFSEIKTKSDVNSNIEFSKTKTKYYENKKYYENYNNNM